MPTPWARRCDGKPRATATCFLIFTAGLISVRSSACASCTSAPMDLTRSRSWRRDPRVRRLLAAAAALVRSGGLAPSGDSGFEIAAAGAATLVSCETGGSGVWLEFPQSYRHGGGFRQERGSAGRVVAAWVRICRNRHRDAKAASRQSAPEIVSAGARRSSNQSDGVQQ